MTECKACQLTESLCRQKGSTCYLTLCDIVNWFQAKKMCQIKGADLAILQNNKNTANEMADHLLDLPNNCSYYWIGISKFSWTSMIGKYLVCFRRMNTKSCRANYS